MTDQEKPQSTQQREAESDHDLQEREQKLHDITTQLDTLLEAAPDTMHFREVLGHKKDNPKRLDVAMLSGRQTINRIEIVRTSYEDGNREYHIEYGTTTSKEESVPYPDELDYSPSNTDITQANWGIQPDGTLQEDLIHYSPETLQTITNRISEFENSELGLVQAAPEEITWPTHMDRARELAKRVLKVDRSK